MFFVLFNVACQTVDEPKHIFYLHPAIVESEGWNATHPIFGVFEGDKIIRSLKLPNTKLHYEIRNQATDFHSFAEDVSQQIDDLISGGIKPDHISVIGASKGGVLGMYISHINKQPIRYVLLASNTTNIEAQNNWQLHGKILAIREKSDTICSQNFSHWQKQSPSLTQFKEMDIHTGLNHGIVLKCRPEWLNPTKDWIK